MVHRVLIIDDDKWIAMSTAMVLEAEGFEVHSATGGVHGLELAVKLQPSLILLDIMMPGIDGWETLERLKEQEEIRSIPVIVFTARENHRGSTRAQELGAVQYVRKPFRPEALLRSIRQHLEEPVSAGGSGGTTTPS